MVLVSKFYDGPVTETDRATNRAGAADYGVIGEGDFMVATHPSIPYALNVAAGKAHGYGVSDTAETTQTVQCSTLASGTRWDLIVVRRNWQPLLGGPSTLVAIQGGSTTPNIETLRTKGPGVEDDQPLALVKWVGGVNTPSQIIDLRCWAGNGGMVAADVLALNYLARPGADVMIGSTPWRFAQGPNGTWAWSAPYSIGADVIAVSAPDTGWAYGVRLSRTLSVDGKEAQIVMSLLVVRISGPAFTIEAASERNLVTGTLIPAGWRPADASVFGAGVVSGPSWGGVGICVNLAGTVTVRSTGGNTPISNGSRITATIAWKLPVS
ncbi:hypothetical protein SAMN04489740_2677 [Arthrobacter alpinus]|uniref:Uncharacterized protein n=1 Tax=Arthrobacter alpinus TaxID=656366 RepID=A0A1H5M0Z4_9MICC|nr:hypothetical protein [Arthrobacter alpinus]SEE82261.1 hypothetical protein SAMN04489740_2677 [Arthrobacter alpinus]